MAIYFVFMDKALLQNERATVFSCDGCSVEGKDMCGK